MPDTNHSRYNRRLLSMRACWHTLLALTFLLVFLPPIFAHSAESEPAAKKKQAPGKGQAKAKKAKKTKKQREAEARQRTESLRTLAAHLGIGKGATIADIGAGRGQDTWVFAEIVGTSGTVLAEEISKDKVKTLESSARAKGLTQVRAVLGTVEDPLLPAAAADLAYMRYVYHHFSKPREMLRKLWHALKPGGYLVIVDKEKGTLQNWVARERRNKEHFWIAETTVVREGREEGFEFVECADKFWRGDNAFVLVFRKPKDTKQPNGDPDRFLPLPEPSSTAAFLPAAGKRYQRPVFIALGPVRRLIKPILEHSAGPGLDIILEEWATQKDERPPLPADLSLPAVLTEKGDPHLGPEPIDAVFFLDSYHLLFHGKTLLAKLRDKLTPDGRVFILDRKAPAPLSRREASHQRRITPTTVKQEMTDAGFRLESEGPQLADDRFLLVFNKE